MYEGELMEAQTGVRQQFYNQRDSRVTKESWRQAGRFHGIHGLGTLPRQATQEAHEYGP